MRLLSLSSRSFSVPARPVAPFLRALAVAALLGLGACGGGQPAADAAQPVAEVTASAPSPAAEPAWPQSDRDVRPLLPGTPVPAATVRTLDGDALGLRDALAGQPAVLVFYRGGWCPYCNTQLSGLRLIRGDLDALGFRLIALSPDTPEHLKKTLDDQALDYTLLSDSGAEAMRGFGIGYQVDAATREKLSGYGIDLEARSGDTHHVLPVPAVFVVDGEGVVQFAYVHPDYTVRLPQDVVLAAAKAIKEQRYKVVPQR